ncbi:hypothetical protein FA95DRAFT_1482442 [Auriscalpium vulgare]|uniref:Uncharacterized protein n=1 Tax=Auriscalpium vulgare TaxID=40419 RepID=A0ACB8SAM3_9AGAM|nr:hypothetical protein FA95DRAFT_1482442 [Auriscalpium vulgare]
MHLIWENLIPNLVLFWTGEFKGLDDNQQYVLAPAVWEAIGAASAGSSKTTPSAFGAAMPNPAQDRTYFTSETWSLWSLFLGPVLLRRRFLSNIFYKHFCSLVGLLKICLQFEITDEELEKIRQGFVDWVQEYERLYYQHIPHRLPTCPVTIHALLHIADSIKMSGPVWASWAFPIERQCGLLQRAIKSRRNPYVNLDNYISDAAQLNQIKLVYNLSVNLSLKPPAQDKNGISLPQYPKCRLLFPRVVGPVSRGIQNALTSALATRYGVTNTTARRHLPAQLEQWGKIRRLEGGDMMHARALVPERGRDASYVRYTALVDRFARQRRRAEELVAQDFFGQLQHIFVIPIVASPDLRLQQSETIALALIRQVKTSIRTEDGTPSIPYYAQDGPLDVVDLQAVQCVVGRVNDRNEWAVFDRSGPLAQAVFVEDE